MTVAEDKSEAFLPLSRAILLRVMEMTLIHTDITLRLKQSKPFFACSTFCDIILNIFINKKYLIISLNRLTVSLNEILLQSEFA